MFVCMCVCVCARGCTYVQFSCELIPIMLDQNHMIQFSSNCGLMYYPPINHLSVLNGNVCMFICMCVWICISVYACTCVGVSVFVREY